MSAPTGRLIEEGGCWWLVETDQDGFGLEEWQFTRRVDAIAFAARRGIRLEEM